MRDWARPRLDQLMHVCGSGWARVLPHNTTVGGRIRVATGVVVIVVDHTAARYKTTRTAAVVDDTATGTVTVAEVVSRATAVPAVPVVPVPTAAVRPGELVHRSAGRQLPALKRWCSVARGLAIVGDRVRAGRAADDHAVAVHRVPTAHPHAAREEQLEKQTLELLAKYHVDDEVNWRVDGDQEVAELDQLVHGHAVERLSHVWYECPDIAQQEHHHDAQQHGGQSDFFLLEPRQPLPLSVRHPHLKQYHLKGQIILWVNCVSPIYHNKILTIFCNLITINILQKLFQMFLNE